MRKLKVLISNNQEKVRIPTGIRMLIRRCCSAVLNEEKVHSNAEISVNLVDNEQIKALNGQFRNKDNVTDVLSFPQYEAGKVPKNKGEDIAVGDIVISIEKAYEQADSFGHTLNREIAFLIVHSMLHLMGYDHEESALQQLKMREKEEIILGKIGMAREHQIIVESEA